MDFEDATIAAASTVLLLIARKKKNANKVKRLQKLRSIWSRQWLLRRNSGRDLAHLVMDELNLEDARSFQNFTRMSRECFLEFLAKVEPAIRRQNTVMRESISSTTRLLLTLRYLATGATYRELSYGFRVSVPSISKIIPETLEAIYLSLKDEYLKMPQEAIEWEGVAKEFEEKWNFPHCLGAIDGKHIAMKGRKSDGSLFYNYKKFNSVILLAAVDANYKFIYIYVGANGRAHDAAVFKECTLFQGIENNLLDFPVAKVLPKSDTVAPYVFVADDAFKLTSRILKPLSQRNNVENKVFNYRLSRARRVVENAFGILTSKFQIFQKAINQSPKRIELITMAACTLHNYIRCKEGFQSGSFDYEDTSAVELIHGSWRAHAEMTNLQPCSQNRSTNDAIGVRNMYSQYFNTVGFVPWQWEAVKKFNF